MPSPSKPLNLIKTMVWTIQIQMFMPLDFKMIETYLENNSFRMRQSLKPYNNNGSGNKNTDVLDFLGFLDVLDFSG